MKQIKKNEVTMVIKKIRQSIETKTVKGEVRGYKLCRRKSKKEHNMQKKKD